MRHVCRTFLSIFQLALIVWALAWFGRAAFAQTNDTAPTSSTAPEPDQVQANPAPPAPPPAEAGAQSRTPTICGKPSDEETETGKKSWRPKAGSDYIVLGYDVDTHSTRWYDYKHGGVSPIFIRHNGSLVPVVYTREKVLVHVCGLHPTDTVTISTNPFSVPEQGGDIRGTTPSTVPALAPTLDSLGVAVAVPATPYGPAGVSFGTPAALANLAANFFTSGSYKDAATYNDAVINISPDALAIETIAAVNNAGDIISTTNELESGYLAPGQGQFAPPGSISRLQSDAQILLEDLGKGGDPSSMLYAMGDGAPHGGDQSLSGFNDALARTQSLVTELNGLATAVSQAGLPARAIALRQNFEAILSVIRQVNQVALDDDSFSNNEVTISGSKTTVKCVAIYQELETPTGKPILPDTPGCHAVERHAMTEFIKRFSHALDTVPGAARLAELSTPRPFERGASFGGKFVLGGAGGNQRNGMAEEGQPGPRKLVAVSYQQPGNQGAVSQSPPCEVAETPKNDEELQVDAGDPPKLQNVAKIVNRMFGKLIEMRSCLGDLDLKVAKIFFVMNTRYRDSRVEQTDALPPMTSNAIERISISVQRNYTPFTLAGGASIGAAAPPVAQSPPSNQGGGQGGNKNNPAGNSPASTPSPGGGNQATISSSGNNDLTVLMEVHHNANFNLVGGVLGIKVKTVSLAVVPEYAQYQLVPGSTTTYEPMGSCNGGSPMQAGPTVTPTGTQPLPTTYTAPYYCFQSTQTSDWQVAGMAGVEWFPAHRDYFPRNRGASIAKTNWIPSLMAASSVTSLGSFFLGPNFEPLNGINFFAGGATAHQAALPKGVSPHAVYWPAGSNNGPPTLTPATHLKAGFSVGIGFDLSVFTQLFSKTQSPGLP